MIKFVILLCALVFLTSCTSGISEEEAKEKFQEALLGKQSCEIDSHCELIYPGCPLGCSISVNAEYSSELRARAADLIERYNAGNQVCDYTCIAVYPVCVIDRCETREL